MIFHEAMTEVGNGNAVFSPTVGGTLVCMPRDKMVMFVPRVTGNKPIRPIVPFTSIPQIESASDWELSGVGDRNKPCP